MIDVADLPEFYGEKDAKVWLTEKVGVEYCNYRFAYRDDQPSVEQYGLQYAIGDWQGISHDYNVMVDGRLAMIGCTVNGDNHLTGVRYEH
jgi:hypothetical protein